MLPFNLHARLRWAHLGTAQQTDGKTPSLPSEAGGEGRGEEVRFKRSPSPHCIAGEEDGNRAAALFE